LRIVRRYSAVRVASIRHVDGGRWIVLAEKQQGIGKPNPATIFRFIILDMAM
jgi:hypothetical protein